MIAEFEARILALIDDMVEHASDDELFAGGYLRGHLTLAVAESEEHAEHSAEQLKVRVQSSLDKAIKAGSFPRRIRYWCWACGKTCIRQRCRLSKTPPHPNPLPQGEGSDCAQFYSSNLPATSHQLAREFNELQVKLCT